MYYLKSFNKFIFKKIPILNPFSTFKLIIKAYIFFLTLTNIFIFSLIIFFDLNYYDLTIFFKISLYSFLVDTLLKVNTAILEKGEIKIKRSKIIIQYFKSNFLPDILSSY